MKVFAIGASRNIGYESCLRFLKAGNTVIFLIRNPSAFDNNEEIKPFIASGRAQVVKGDALNVDDIRNGWAVAIQGDPVDLVFFAVGGTPSFSPTKGLVITPANLCSSAVLNVLSTFPSTSGNTQPKFLAITSHGVTKDSHAALPLLVRPVYALLHSPHDDKLAMERVIMHSAGWEWKEGEDPELLPTGWQDQLPSPGWLKSVVVVRPALLTDGESKGKYRVEEDLSSSYSISRKDVAHFIAGDCVENWDKYENRAVSVGY